MRGERSIRVLQTTDIPLVTDYFHRLTTGQLRGMGVDPAKLPDIDQWNQLIHDDLQRPITERQFYYLLWLLDGTPVGHSNLNKIVYGNEAFLHLHVWQPRLRRSGHGVAWLRASIPAYFETFELRKLCCEPFAGNPGPNRTLPYAGFQLLKTYATVPGWINYRQTVNRWELSREQWLAGRTASGRATGDAV